MFNVSYRSLKILTALFWYTGGVVLILKGTGLLFKAAELKPHPVWLWLAAFAGLSIGTLKAIFLFSRSCQKNLARINALTHPKIWQFFKPGFFAFLLLMIVAGATLSQLAQNNYSFLISVAILDFSIATALIGSSYIFWIKNISVK